MEEVPAELAYADVTSEEPPARSSPKILTLDSTSQALWGSRNKMWTWVFALRHSPIEGLL